VIAAISGLIIGLVVLAVLLVAAAGFLFTKRSGRNLPLEPPSRSNTAPPKQTGSGGGTTAVLDRPGDTDVLDRPIGDVRERVAVDGVVVEPPVAPTADVAPSVDVAPVEEQVVEPLEEPAEEFRPRFRDRLAKARGLLGGYFGSVLGRSAIDPQTWDELEEALIRADMGIGVTTSLLDDLKKHVKTEGIKESSALMDRLKVELKARLGNANRELNFEAGRPNVWLFVGVNGVGKTTTIGKIGKREVLSGRTVIMAAGDTFRAAAAEQLGMWAERTGADLVRGKEGGDPGSVIFDAVERAAAKKIDLVLGDTAGRLQTKTNLMEELRKIRRIADKEPGKVTEVLLVLDATTGQNGLVQAKQFGDVADLTGVVLTKLDGTAKGGIAFAIETELGIPIKLVGLGEGVNDLVPFDPDEYVEALFA
jgi:fused signal recognition particle receptor